MWKLKYPEKFKIYNKSKVAKELGITGVTLRNVVNGTPCSKIVALVITKFLDSNSKIEDYFEKVGE